MSEAGIDSVRLPLFWSGIETEDPEYAEPDWSGFDREVELAAEADIRVMPFVFSTPEWVAPETTDLPVAQRLAAPRPGPTSCAPRPNATGPTANSGTNTRSLPFLPIHRWEIWNEENLVTFATPPNPVAYATPAADLRPGPAQRRQRCPGDRRRPLRPAAAGAAQRRLGRLPLAPLPGAQREALLRRGRPAPLRGRSKGHGGPAGEPAADHARPPRPDDAALRDRAGLGLPKRPDALAARPRRPGQPALEGVLAALGQPSALADRRRLVVHLDRRRRQLPVLPLGRPADRRSRGEAVLVPLQRLDGRRRRTPFPGRNSGTATRSRRRKSPKKPNRSKPAAAAANRRRRPRAIRVVRLHPQTSNSTRGDARCLSPYQTFPTPTTRSSPTSTRRRCESTTTNTTRPTSTKPTPPSRAPSGPTATSRTSSRASPACPPTSRARSATTPAATTTTRSSGR